MPYNDDTRWQDWSASASAAARQMINALNYGREEYYNWQTFRDGRDNAAIATALSRTESEVADLDACFSALKNIYDFSDNVAGPTQADRFYQLRQFS